ncbi:unnamed protein product [Enterobius vermicularis]|uniref:Exonuclease domain-containing protein n=1 Tax=Enterobius vermicularis TaxID=51028 RepID=A0A3P6IKT5_ENTVE|nr:unnamed protein product [Enterobius vermicularis]
MVLCCYRSSSFINRWECLNTGWVCFGCVSPSKQSLAVKKKLRNRMVQQKFDYFLVVDFEATCEENKKIQPVQEIIEFPVCQIDAHSLDEIDRFHQYVRPTENQFLTSFCSNLTGIVQETVDKSNTLPLVLEDFDKWLFSRGLLNSDGTNSRSWIMVTCGDWDLGVQLPQEAEYRGLNEWINMKKAFSEALGHYPNSLSTMLQDLGIEPVVCVSFPLFQIIFG